MKNTKPVRVSEGVHAALTEMAEQTKVDLSTTTSFFLLAMLFGTEAYKTFKAQTQAMMVADFMEGIADYIRLAEIPALGKVAAKDMAFQEILAEIGKAQQAAQKRAG